MANEPKEPTVTETKNPQELPPIVEKQPAMQPEFHEKELEPKKDQSGN